MTIKSLNHIRAVLQSEADELCACIRCVNDDYAEAAEDSDIKMMLDITEVKERLLKSLHDTQEAISDIDEMIAEWREDED